MIRKMKKWQISYYQLITHEKLLHTHTKKQYFVHNLTIVTNHHTIELTHFAKSNIKNFYNQLMLN